MALYSFGSSLILFAFAGATALFLQNRSDDQPGNRIAVRVGLAFFVIGTLLTTLLLGGQFSSMPAQLNVSALLLMTCLAALSLIAYMYYGFYQIIKFASPLITLIMILAIFFKSKDVSPVPQLPMFHNNGGALLATHIIFSSLGQAFAILACIISMMYLWQQRVLKKKIMDQITAKMPSLGRLEHYLNLCIWVGFIFISLALVTGALLAPSLDKVNFSFQTKVLWAVLVWIWYLAILLSRNIFKLPAKRMAQLSLGGFFLLAMSFFGLSFASGLIMQGGAF